MTQQVNHRPIKCQSPLCSQRGTKKVNGSHHGDNPLLRPTEIQIATKSYAALQAMAPTNNSKRFIKPPYSVSRAITSVDSECCRLPTTSVLSKKRKNTLQPVLINKSKFLKATHCCCCCCCFSHSAHWLPTRKKLLYTVANPARGLLNRGKKKKKSLAAHPPPPPARCTFGEKIKIIKLKIRNSRGASTCLGVTQAGVTQVVVSVRLASVQGFLRLVS